MKGEIWLYFNNSGRENWRTGKCCKSKKNVLLRCACLLDKRCLTASPAGVEREALSWRVRQVGGHRLVKPLC